VKIIETAISAYDGSTWVADLDIAVPFAGNDFSFGRAVQGCRQTCREVNSEGIDTEVCSGLQSSFDAVAAAHRFDNIIAIDSWYEILDPPQCDVIAIRAASNWVARLALAAACTKKGCYVVIANKTSCWYHFFDIVRRSNSQAASFFLQEDSFTSTNEATKSSGQAKRKTADDSDTNWQKRSRYVENGSHGFLGFNESWISHQPEVRQNYSKFALLL
jgi:hypothetical protein